MKWIELTPAFPKGDPGEYEVGTFHIPVDAIETIFDSPGGPVAVKTGKSSVFVDETPDQIKAKIEEAMK